MLFHFFFLSLSFSFLHSVRPEDNEEEIKKRRKRERGRRRMRRQPVTNLTLNQLTCARLHKRMPVHTSVRARSLDAGYSLSCNMCNIMYMRCFPLGYSRRRRSEREYVYPLNKLARARCFGREDSPITKKKERER